MKYIKWFEEVTMKDISIVGGKNASLGEMISSLAPKGVEIPSGFATSADAYRYYLKENGLETPIKNLLDKIDMNDLKGFQSIGQQIRDLIVKAKIPKDLEENIKDAYEKMEERYSKNCAVAIRSSATAEDLPEASFAGQQETFLNVSGIDEVLDAYKKAIASLFTDRAISYRIHNGFDHMDVALSAGIQKMVRSDLASAGVIFTLDTESGFKDVVFVTSSYGYGENVVQGSVDPDEFYVFKDTLKEGYKPLLKKRLGSKKKKLIATEDKNNPTKNVDVPESDQILFSISDSEALELARQALVIEDHYSSSKGHWVPMDIEWAKDGLDGKLYILQARPETVHSQKQAQPVIREYDIDTNAAKTADVLARGKAVGQKIATGRAVVISSAKEMDKVKEDEILVTEMTDPDWEPIMKKAGGIITNSGGRTCHAAIISRELGIVAIVGTGDATKKIKTGDLVTIDCSSGDEGLVYSGEIGFEVNEIKVNDVPKLPVKIYMNVGNPNQAFKLAKIPAEGIGLARLEFIIGSSIQIHPMALVQPDKVTREEDKKIIARLTAGYEDKKQYFVDKLAQEAGTIAAAFYPKPVVIRMSDFKSNEYRQLLAGSYFEPEEENPMIGFRGASRYYHEKYKDAFVLECKAMKKIREEMGLTNVKLMIPFVRTVQEGQKVIDIMRENGLVQGENGLEIIMMCEVPSNVLLIEEFAKVFDGFSIGSNDLTQLTLAVDRDSALVAPIFDERNEALKIMIKKAIEGAHKSGKPIGICGQAPSDYPEIAKMLLDLKIDSMSLNPDSVLKTMKLLGVEEDKTS